MPSLTRARMTQMCSQYLRDYHFRASDTHELHELQQIRTIDILIDLCSTFDV